jgi:hypothetical protein
MTMINIELLDPERALGVVHRAILGGQHRNSSENTNSTLACVAAVACLIGYAL